MLLAVSANEIGIKILANADGLRLLRTFENRSFISEPVTKACLQCFNQLCFVNLSSDEI